MKKSLTSTSTRGGRARAHRSGRENGVHCECALAAFTRFDSPLFPAHTQYRALLNLRAIEEILERERPDINRIGRPVSDRLEAAIDAG